MITFKTLVSSATASAFFATSAVAGGLAQRVAPIEPIVIEDMEQDSSSAAIIVPLLVIALIALAASGGSDDDNDENVVPDIQVD